MPLYWGKLVIQDVYGAETQALEQPIYVEHFTNNGFVRTIEDSCTALPAITGFTLQSDPNNNVYTVLTTGVVVPPQVLAEHPAANLNSGQRAIRFSAPGAGARGVIDSVLISMRTTYCGLPKTKMATTILIKPPKVERNLGCIAAVIGRSGGANRINY